MALGVVRPRWRARCGGPRRLWRDAGIGGTPLAVTGSGPHESPLAESARLPRYHYPRARPQYARYYTGPVRGPDGVPETAQTARSLREGVAPGDDRRRCKGPGRAHVRRRLQRLL